MELAHLFRKRGIMEHYATPDISPLRELFHNLYSRGMASGFGYIRPSRQL